ncbi:hypothetical protein DGWBC_1563 [Dehalogenimonas sp. WBC-2]|nr:hypothetical protein DGWBC_1563 [Dehalogenimonas sp. WBC-2]
MCGFTVSVQFVRFCQRLVNIFVTTPAAGRGAATPSRFGITNFTQFSLGDERLQHAIKHASLNLESSAQAIQANGIFSFAEFS